MTYCIGIKTKDGIVVASDSRTNAGLDNVNIYSKMFTHDVGDRTILIVTSGNLGTSQAVFKSIEKDLADKYHRDGLHGAMLWFDVAGGDTAAISLMNTIQRPWSLCENLGATESIITACAVMTHANMLVEDRLKVGVSDGFIRISCGIEYADDLIRALSESLDQI